MSGNRLIYFLLIYFHLSSDLFSIFGRGCLVYILSSWWFCLRGGWKLSDLETWKLHLCIDGMVGLFFFLRLWYLGQMERTIAFTHLLKPSQTFAFSFAPAFRYSILFQQCLTAVLRTTLRNVTCPWRRFGETVSCGRSVWICPTWIPVAAQVRREALRAATQWEWNGQPELIWTVHLLYFVSLCLCIFVS